MSHLELEAMRRILAGKGGPREAESVAEHLDSCDRCLAQAGTLIEELRAEKPGLRGDGPLQPVFDRIDRERRRGEEYLAAFAERAAQRRTNRRSQRDRVRMTKACHTIAFFNLVLEELREESSWTEAEFLASLALLSVEAMRQRQQITEAAAHDLQAQVWTAVANSRRKAAEWKHTHQALKDAGRHRQQGTGEPRLEAALLSISASTLADEGRSSQALDALDRCTSIYESLSEWALLARTFIKRANILVETQPGKALEALDHAAPLIPAEDWYLTLLAELLRVRCLIDLQKPTEALLAYRVVRRCSMAVREFACNFAAASRVLNCWMLLDSRSKPGPSLMVSWIAISSTSSHKDAFLDLLYIYERHMKAGNLEKAARVCRKALTNGSLVAIAHDQMRDVWTQLLEAAQHQVLSQDVLRDLRQYLSVHWKHPAGTPPKVRASR